MRLIALTVLLVSSTSLALAQDSTVTTAPRDSAVRGEAKRWGGPPPAQRAMIGPFGGVNFAKFGGEDVSGVDTRTGFQLGLFASLPLGRIASIRPSVAYSQQGTKLDGGSGVTLTFKLNYIEVPVLLHLSAPLQGSGDIRPYIEAGPAIGFEASCKVEGSNGTQSTTLDCDDDQLGLESKSTIFSVHFGAGVEISRFFIGARYQLGLSSIDDTGGNSDIKNRVIAIMAGYGFRLGH